MGFFFNSSALNANRTRVLDDWGEATFWTEQWRVAEEPRGEARGTDRHRYQRTPSEREREEKRVEDEHGAERSHRDMLR